MKKLAFIVIIALSLVQCKTPEQKENDMNKGISESKITGITDALVDKYGDASRSSASKGVKHAASLWRDEDGSAMDFEEFCLSHFVNDDAERMIIFNKTSQYFESLFGHFSRLSLELRKNLDLDNGPLNPIDEMFGAYSPGAHLTDDFFANKIAFIIALNFPYYSLEEKNELGKNWNDKEWAFARLGDVFNYRVPADLQQKITSANSAADVYISQYNIFMGKLVDDAGKSIFPADMVLLSHWNLRDELKSNYAVKDIGFEKQKLIYEVMKRIIRQEIPEKVINSDEYTWNPVNNKTYKDGQEVSLTAEPDTRYQKILDNFHSLKAVDEYTGVMNTNIKRRFSGEMEIPQPEVESIFDEYLRSPVLKELAAVVKTRLGRDLRPFDIWYDGFKSRSSIPQEELNKITEKLYPDAAAFEAGMPDLLVKLGFKDDKAKEISSFITVDAARGSGHAWGAQMRSDKSHLRTRIGATGMNYKGFNIAVHEFGHNVEQTISLHNVPYYTLSGVPNTAFTEAIAFLFQKRDLELLGYKNTDAKVQSLKTLDICWSTFEIMAVSMVDMKIWKWMYENPNATATQLKEQTVSIAKDVWNTYFSEAYGIKDEPVLAIYSHMVNSPLYLANYSFGALIEFQVGQYLIGKDFAMEVERIWSLGRLTPQTWILKATGEDLSAKPLLEAAEKAIKNI